MEKFLSVMKEDHLIKDQLLQVMIDNEGSDIYITVGTYPAIKISGEIIRINEGLNEFTAEDTFDFAKSIITEEQHRKLLETKNLDFSFTYNNRRFRTNISFQLGYYMIVARLLTAEVPNIDDLGLPDIYKNVTKKGQGLILVTGPTGSGKTTTLGAMIDYINENYNKHIITIEDPIEYVHKHKSSIIEHKEIGRDIPDYETGLIGAMRQAPNVILFGEMRNRKEIEMALRLAETGHLVFSTLHTRSAAQTVTRILDSFSGDDKNQVRVQLADSLIAVFSQRLLKLKAGRGIRLAKEILIKTSAVSNLIRENDIHQIPSVMQIGQNEGMQLLENDIITLIKSGEISLEEGLKFANNPKFIEESL